MEKRHALLRQKIDILRVYLREGLDISMAASCLLEIAQAEHELRHLCTQPEPEEC